MNVSVPLDQQWPEGKSHYQRTCLNKSSDIYHCANASYCNLTNMTDTAQLMVFVWMENSSMKEDYLTLLPLKKTTMGEGIYKFKRYIYYNNIPT